MSLWYGHKFSPNLLNRALKYQSLYLAWIVYENAVYSQSDGVSCNRKSQHQGTGLLLFLKHFLKCDPRPKRQMYVNLHHCSHHQQPVYIVRSVYVWQFYKKK